MPVPVISSNGASNGSTIVQQPTSEGTPISPIGGWLASVPGSPFWIARELAAPFAEQAGVTIGEAPPSPGEEFLTEHGEQLISEAGEIGKSAVVTAVIVGGVLIALTALGVVAYVKLS